MTKHKHFSISTNSEIEKLIEKEMEETGKTRNKIVHEAIYKHLERKN